MDEPSEMVPEASSDSGSGLSEPFAHQDGSEASWLGLLLTSASAMEQLLLHLREGKIARVTWTNISSFFFHPSPLEALFPSSAIVP
jgi:hypothetical protein